MEKINIFCVLGKSGSGKSYYMNNEFMKFLLEKFNIKTLVYGTTRSIRKGEVEGTDYHYFTNEEYSSLDKTTLIEDRLYNTINGPVHYFTKEEYFNIDSHIICAVSPYQYASYKSYLDPEKYNVYPIIITCNTDNRILRVMKNRCKSENDIYEAMRRMLDERKEFEEVEKEFPEIDTSKTYEDEYNRCIVDNNCYSEISNFSQLEEFFSKLC